MDTKLIIRTDEKWYNQVPVPPTNANRVPRDRELELKREAEALLAEENEKYQKLEKKSKKSDVLWIRSVLTKGALSDKVAAHTLLLQNSAPHNLSSLSALVQMSQSKGKREYLLAMSHLKDLFLADLLPQRKLKPFNELVSGLEGKDGKARCLHLMIAYFEDQLRYQYHQFVEGVERVTHDPVPETKSKSINVLFELLSSNPEHEQFLLEKLVNKLGDPSSKVASHVSFLLQKLITENHPVMKEVVVNEVHRVLFRPNISEKAQYYCLCFLQGIVFTDFDQLLANKMIEMYFTFFKKVTSSGDVNSKIMSALLSGMSRALPYSTLGAAALETHLETFYRLIHYVNQNIAIQGLSLIFSVINHHKSAALSDRYYSVLWKFLLDHDLEKTKRLTMLLNLLFRSLKRDKKPARVYSFIRKLTSVALNLSPPLLASVLFLVSQILLSNRKVATMFYMSQSERIDSSDRKPNAKQRNMNPTLQNVTNSALETSTSASHDNSNQQEMKDERKTSNPEWDMTVRNPLLSNPNPEWDMTVRNPLLSNPNPEWDMTVRNPNPEWDMTVRNPLFLKPELVSPWEFSLLTHHYHPSVSLFAECVTKRETVSYDGDPIEDFSLKHFLDRFVYRNPKEVDSKDSLVSRQKSIFGRQKRIKRDTERNVDTKEYLDLPESRIPLEERFIYKYLKDKGPKAKREKDDEDIESVASEEFEQLLDKFESDFNDEDFASELKQEKVKKGKKRSHDDDPSEESDDDDEMNFEDDEEYQAAFGSVKNDLEDAFENDDEDADEKPKSKYVRKGMNEKMTGIFESAEKFAHLLNEDDDDSDKDSGDEVRTSLSKVGEGKDRKYVRSKGSNLKKRSLNKKVGSASSKLVKRKKMMK